MSDYFTLACAATRGRYRDYERVAQGYVDALEESVQRLKYAGVTDKNVEKYISSVKDCWLKESRCLIAGPANFPVEKQKKMREHANKANEKMAALFTKLFREVEIKKKYK